MRVQSSKCGFWVAQQSRTEALPLIDAVGIVQHDMALAASLYESLAVRIVQLGTSFVNHGFIECLNFPAVTPAPYIIHKFIA